jgi:AhpD family alkylhydroperoxidase
LRNTAAAAVVAILGGLSVPASATDPSQQIHTDNQNVGAGVSAFWESRMVWTPAASPAVPQYHGVANFLTFQDMQEHLGMVPSFFHLFPEEKLAGLWEEYKVTQLNPATALDARTKQLIGLAVAAQAGCSPCVYFQSSAAFAGGASFKEVQETVAISVIGGHWSEHLTQDTFRTVRMDTDALVRLGVFDAPEASN